jgi:hypothetical protein
MKVRGMKYPVYLSVAKPDEPFFRHKKTQTIYPFCFPIATFQKNADVGAFLKPMSTHHHQIPSHEPLLPQPPQYTTSRRSPSQAASGSFE